MLRIEPVRPADYPRAVALLSAGEDATGRSEGFLAMLSGRGARRCHFWWARGLLGARAAAMAVRNPGHSAMVYHSPPSPGGDVSVLARVLGRATDDALAAGAVFVQALLRLDAHASAEAHIEAGYELLATLVYLRRSAEPPAEESPTELTWVSLRQSSEAQLARVIADTYVDSRDCPALLGRRRMEHVIAGHKSNGVFRPDSWFLPALAGECVGCVLLNDSAARGNEAEVAYLGVRPAWRRRGVGRAMLRHALNDAARRGRPHVCLAVDATNVAARRLYESEGFREVNRNDVYVRSPGGDAQGQA